MIRNYTIICFILAISALNLSFKSSYKSLFIDEFAPLAVKNSIEYGIPASIKLAQAIHESNWGTSDLAQKANNYFGIKCKTEWTGLTYMHIDDDRDATGKLIPSCFRAYDHKIHSWQDHSKFLRYRKYYTQLFTLRNDDYIGWAKGLKAAGYATDSQYDLKLIKIIEQYDLYKFDQSTFKEFYSKQ